MASEVAKDLKKMSKMWAKTEAKQGGGGGSRLPDGEYLCKIVDMKVGKSKNKRLQVVTEFKVKKPKDKKGKTFLKFSGLESEDNIAYFKGFAEVLGLELPEDMEDLPEALESFVEEFDDDVTIKLVTKGDFQNSIVVAVGDNEVAKNEEDSEEEDNEDNEEDSEEEDNEDNEEDSEEEEDGDSEEEDNEDGEEDGEEEDEPKKKKKSKKEKKKKRKSRR